MEPFMRKRTARSTARTVNELHGHSARSVRSQARMASGSVHSEKALTAKTRKENAFTDY